MLYQLANGKTIKMTEEQYFKLTDEQLRDLEGSNYGYIINDPFIDSALGTDPIDDILDSLDTEPLPEVDRDFLDVDE